MAGSDDHVPSDRPGAEEPGWSLSVETCRIELSRGYRTAVFYAQSAGGPSGVSATEPSSPFRWRKSAGAKTEEARLAHDELLARLKTEGWTPSGQGGDWYATEFTLPVLVRADARAPLPDEPVELLEPEPVIEPVALPAALHVLAPPTAPPRAPEETDVRSADPSTGRWQLVSAAGLVAALALLTWIATHASAVGALGH